MNRGHGRVPWWKPVENRKGNRLLRRSMKHHSEDNWNVGSGRRVLESTSRRRQSSPRKIAPCTAEDLRQQMTLGIPRRSTTSRHGREVPEEECEEPLRVPGQRIGPWHRIQQQQQQRLPDTFKCDIIYLLGL